MVKITPQNFIANKFSKGNTKKIVEILDFVNFNASPQQILQEILSKTTPQLFWAIGTKPAYSIQYQIDSVAIIKINDICLIVWKPKYIQYPQMIKFPQLKDKKLNSAKFEVDRSSTNITQGNESELIKFLQQFYGTYFYNDNQFQTNLVLNAKQFITKITSVCYWHVLYDDTIYLHVMKEQQLQCAIKIRVTGIKQGYDKTLFLFSKKGKRDNMFGNIKNKWIQLLSFLSMLLIFISVVSCSAEDTQGICQYRNQMMIGGAGVMMSIFGMKIATRNKNKKPVQKKRDQ